MVTLKLFLLQFTVILSCCEAYKVLVIFTLPGKSHSILGDGIVRHLASAGNEVTYITPFTYKPASPNVRTIDVSDLITLMPIDDIANLDILMKQELDMSSHLFLIYMFSEYTKSVIKHENVQKLINDPKEEFDVIITEWMFTELSAGLAAVFDCPYIWSSSLDVHWSVLKLIDEHSNPAYTPDAISSKIPPFTFGERVNELYIQLKVSFLKTIFDWLDRRAYDNMIAPSILKRGRQSPSYYDIKYNASLMLVNSHPSLSTAQSMPQNAIHIGGYHIEEDVKPLPEDLKKIMDNAKNGLIYFSMGSNLKSRHFTKQLRDSILNMFGELKQTVLWKFEEDLPNRPKNVHILKWAPQQSILSHPNTVLFITHGGLLSTTETIHFGKPIVGIPVFADQFTNVERAVKRGFAKKVTLSYTMAPEMKLAIEEVVNNPRYAEKAKELSLIYHDRPVSPGKNLVHWVNHVVKTGGALHLRSPALNVPFYQKLYLDLLAVILVLSFVFFKILKLVCRSYCGKKRSSSKKNN